MTGTGRLGGIGQSGAFLPQPVPFTPVPFTHVLDARAAETDGRWPRPDADTGDRPSALHEWLYGLAALLVLIVTGAPLVRTLGQTVGHVSDLATRADLFTTFLASLF